MIIVYIYIILFLLFIILLLLWLVSGCRHVARGVCEIKKIKKDIRDKKKEDRKKIILKLLKENKKFSNKELKKKLKVSRKTIVNYCDELEKEGKIKQVGKTGRSAYYKLK